MTRLQLRNKDNKKKDWKKVNKGRKKEKKKEANTKETLSKMKQNMTWKTTNLWSVCQYHTCFPFACSTALRHPCKLWCRPRSEVTQIYRLTGRKIASNKQTGAKLGDTNTSNNNIGQTSQARQSGRQPTCHRRQLKKFTIKNTVPCHSAALDNILAYQAKPDSNKHTHKNNKKQMAKQNSTDQIIRMESVPRQTDLSYPSSFPSAALFMTRFYFTSITQFKSCMCAYSGDGQDI